MTSVLAFKPGHDGAIAFLDEGRLVMSIEGEKDSFERNGPVTAALMSQALELAPCAPDIVALGGWHKVLPGFAQGLGAGYHGLEPGRLIPTAILGRPSLTYSASHERSHLFSAVAMSPFDPCEDIAVLVWEGVIGSLYRWRDYGRAIEQYEVLAQPGSRYAALFAIADPSFPDAGAILPSSLAGKLMALVGFDDGEPQSADSLEVVASLLKVPNLNPFDKARYRLSPLFNCGVTDPEVCRAARLLSDKIFARFLGAAEEILPPGLPLVISGGCGLNCDWNSRWDACGHFREVFVPPCANDSGSAIGTAVDAWAQTGAPPTIEWDVYRGAPFVDDAKPAGWVETRYDPVDVSAVLEAGNAVGWIQGKAEIGPRALGHRSLLASAALPSSKSMLNNIKRRESYRPIAPVCLESDLGEWFDSADPDPYMLRFRRVREPTALPAITHVDGSARVQSVTAESCPTMYELLTNHRRRTGAGVLCNTSLNFKGRGFINRMSELLAYCDHVGIDNLVVNDRRLTRRHLTARS